MRPLTRRALLAGFGLTSLAAGLGSTAAFAASSGRGRVVLIDGRMAREDQQRAVSAIQAGERSGIAASSSPTLIVLGSELVRQWREQLGDLLDRDHSLQAVVRWDYVELLRGLSREAGASISVDRLNGGVFHAIIDGRRF